MEQYLREWRKNALDKHQYETAIFIADKLLALTNSDLDAWWLASIHFNLANYIRAQSVLSRSELTSRSPACKHLAALCYVRQSKYDEALALLGDKNPVHLISSAGESRRKLQQVNRAKDHKTIRLERIDRSEERVLEPQDTIRSEAAMCYLRGLCHAKKNAFDRAKECYKDAVRIDVQCFEAFDALMTNALMSPDEEWGFLESLNFDCITVGDGTDPSLSQEAAAFTKLLYTTRISKYAHPAEFTSATETLSTHYNLSNNPDILLAKASLLFTQCRFKDALTLTTSILDTDPYNFPAIPVHLACLHELGDKNALYLLSHNLADTHPSEPTTHLAIGVYYLTINQIASARRFFSKASILDPHFGPAWIGFAHTFAAEGEHDQAISAYSTAARLFQGTHLPSLFLGMQNIQLSNLSLAKEYLKCAWDLCQTDPLLLNELGVVYYHDDCLDEAVHAFSQALTLAARAASTTASPSKAQNGASASAADDDASAARVWLPARANLGHALRRQGRARESLRHFDEVLRRGGRDAAALSARALALLELGEGAAAAVALHEALAVAPQDPVATDLLARALEACGDEPVMSVADEEEATRRIGEVGKGLMRGRRGALGFVREDGRMVLDEGDDEGEG